MARDSASTGANAEIEEVIFTCLTLGDECEWFHLKDFVSAFNAIHGTSYDWSKCIDVYGPDNKQPARAQKRPEVMIEARGETPIVIERKAVVWPATFQRDHSKEHYLPIRISSLLGENFRDSIYQLELYAEDLKGKNLRQVEGFAKQIAQHIGSSCERAKSVRGIRGRQPVRWAFRALGRFEIDQPSSSTGFQSSVIDRGWDFEPRGRSSSRARALEGFVERLDREVNRASRKFDEYADCHKLVVVQFFGESDCVMDEDIIDIAKAVRLPNQIDQVWLTGRKWVSLNDYELAWERVR